MFQNKDKEEFEIRMDKAFCVIIHIFSPIFNKLFLVARRVARDYWIRVSPSVCQLFRWVSIPRPNSKTTGQNRMKLSTMKEYILKLCTWVLISSCDQNWGRTTWSKMRNFNTIWSLLFRDRTPQLRGRIEWNFRSCDLKCRCTDLGRRGT